MTTLDERLRDLARELPAEDADLPSAREVARRGAHRRRRRHATRAAVAVSAAAAVGGLGLSRPWQDDTAPDDLVAADDDPTPDGDARPDAGPTADTIAGPDPTADPGEDTVAVPDVRGRALEEARVLLAEVGFQVEVAGPAAAGVVTSQTPAPGTAAPAGGAVQLVTGTGGPDRSGMPRIEGELLDGGGWVVADDPAHGLCVLYRGADYGCDDVGPAVPEGADPATPRTAASGDPAIADPLDAVELLYGYLPPGATDARAQYAYVRVGTAPAVIGDGMWAVPVTPGDLPDSVVFSDAAGAEVARLPVG